MSGCTRRAAIRSSFGERAARRRRAAARVHRRCTLPTPAEAARALLIKLRDRLPDSPTASERRIAEAVAEAIATELTQLHVWFDNTNRRIA